MPPLACLTFKTSSNRENDIYLTYHCCEEKHRKDGNTLQRMRNCFKKCLTMSMLRLVRHRKQWVEMENSTKITYRGFKDFLPSFVNVNRAFTTLYY